MRNPQVTMQAFYNVNKISLKNNDRNKKTSSNSN